MLYYIVSGSDTSIGNEQGIRSCSHIPPDTSFGFKPDESIRRQMHHKQIWSNNIKYVSLDWFTAQWENYRNLIQWSKLWFPADLPLNQSNECIVRMESHIMLGTTNGSSVLFKASEAVDYSSGPLQPDSRSGDVRSRVTFLCWSFVMTHSVTCL